MRLLFLSSLYPPAHLGGMELRCQEVAEHLRRRGHTIHVLTSSFAPESGELPKDEAHVSRTLSLQADVYHYHPTDFFFKRPSQERANKQALRQTLDRFRPDLVFIWGMWNLSRNIPYWLERWMPGRVAYSIASYWLVDPDIHVEYWRLPTRRGGAQIVKAPLRWLALSLLRSEGYPPPLRLEQAACCSQYVRDTLVAENKLPSTARVIYSGIDPTPYLQLPALQNAASQRTGNPRPAEPGALRLLYFGSLLPHKGVLTAIRALGHLKRRGSLDGLELTLLGSGHPEYEQQLRREAEAQDVNDRVVFDSWIPRAELPAYLAQFDVFLFTSTWAEPLARTVMEAMAAGLLVIGTRVGGQAEMLFDGENALVFEPENAEELADRIAQAKADPALRSSLAQAGRQMVLERFTVERMVSDYEEWLQTIVMAADQGGN